MKVVRFSITVQHEDGTSSMLQPSAFAGSGPRKELLDIGIYTAPKKSAPGVRFEHDRSATPGEIDDYLAALKEFLDNYTKKQ